MGRRGSITGYYKGRSDAGNDYIRMRLLRDREIGDLITWAEVYDIARTHYKSSANSPNRIIKPLIDYGFIEKVSDGLYRKVLDFHIKDIIYMWMPNHYNVMIRVIKVDGIVAKMETIYND